MSRLGRGYPGPARWIRPHGSTTSAVVLAAVAATATVTAPAPTLTKGPIPASVATVTVSAPAPSLTVAVRFDVPTASVTVSAPVPTLIRGALRPPAASATASAPAPTIAISGGPVSLASPAAVATASAPAPTLTRSALRPPAATVVAAAITPSLNISGSPLEFEPPAAVVTVSAPAPTLILPVTLEALDASLIQQATLQLDIPSGVLVVEHLAAAVPPGIVERALRLSVQNMPALTAGISGRYHSDGDFPTTVATFGVPHLFIDGVDVTYLRGIPADIRSWSFVEPFGDEVAVFGLPQFPPFERNGEAGDDLSYLGFDREVEIVIIEPDGARHPVWNGFLVSEDTTVSETEASNELHAVGLLFGQADAVKHQPPTWMPPTDMGWVVADVLNSVPSRRFAPIPRFTFGKTTRTRGSDDQSKAEYVKQILAEAWDDDGRQLTVRRTGPRTYGLTLKELDVVDYTLQAGMRGAALTLTRDATQKYTTIWGRGTGVDGHTWANWRYSALIFGDVPAFPGTISVGTSSDAVTELQWRMNDVGYGVTVDGAYSADDAEVMKRLQRDYGLAETGVVDSATWAMMYDTGPAGGDLNGARRLPLISDPKVDPSLYAPNGEPIGPRPEYDIKVQPREVQIVWPPDVGRDEAYILSKRQLARDEDAGLAGRLTLRADLPEGSRFLMPAGLNLQVNNWHGGDFMRGFADWIMHAARIQVDLAAEAVNIDLDSKFRDAMTLAQVLKRNRDAQADPAKQPGNPNRRSRQVPDMAVEYDGEQHEGLIPKVLLHAGWNVLRPRALGQVGRIVRAHAEMGVPFAWSLWGLEPTDAWLNFYVPNPLAVKGPFDQNGTLFDDNGLINAWGQLGDACGYFPKRETGDAGGEAGPFTGKFETTEPVEFVGYRNLWVWPAFWVASPGYLSFARLDLAPNV